MSNYLKKIFFIIDYKYKIFYIFFILFVIVSLLEVATLGIIGPYLSLLTSPKEFYNNLLIYFPSFPNNIQINYLIVYFGLLVFLVITFKTIIFLICQYFIAKFTWNEIVSNREKLSNKYKMISYERYIKKNSSEYIQNVVTICKSFVQQTLRPGIQILSDSVMALSIIIFLMFTDFIVFLSISFVLIFIGFIFDRFFKKRLISWGKIRNEAATEIIKGVENSYHGYKETKILNKVGIFTKFILRGSKTIAKIESKTTVINLLPRSIIELLAVAILVVFIFIYIIFQNYYLIDIIPKLVVFFMAAIKLGPAMAAINVNINYLRTSKYVVDKLYEELTEELPLSENNNQYKRIDDFLNFQKVSFINLSYKYPDTENYVIKNINFEINKGDILGVTGPSGSGKTTCIDLFLGLIFPTTGKVKINNTVLTKDNASSWHNKIAYLPQEIFIINESILRNITLKNDDEYNPEFLKDVLIKTNLYEFIKQLSDGINTSVGEKGVNLSGGQRQRIALARSLYHKRDIIVMDESTSSLDFKTEKKIINEILLLKNNTTIIIISHNPNVLSICDKIMYVEKGNVKKIDNLNNYLLNDN